MEVQSLAMLANMLAHKFNIEVRAVGSMACCSRNGGTTEITVPAFVADTDAARVYVRGFIDHEIGHARFTDWDVQMGTPSGSPLHHITNILEDVYVERMMGKCYPGCAINLANMQKQLFVRDKVYENISTPSDADAAIMWHFFRYLLYRARGIEELISEAETGLESVLPGLAGKLDELLKERMHKCNSTKDNLELARDIQKLFSCVADEQASDDFDDAHDKMSGTPEYADTISNAKAKQSASDCMKCNTSRCSDEVKDFVNVRLEEMSTAIEHSVNMSNSEVRRVSPDMGGYTGHDLKASQRAVSSIPSDVKAMAMGCATAMSAQLQSLMQAKVLRKRRTGMQGKLDTNRLHRITMNNPNVFLRNNETKQTNTQVIILGDTSGSMDVVRKLASASIYAVMSALRNIHGVQSAAFGFGDWTISTMCDFNTPLYHGSMYIDRPTGGTPGGTALQRVMQKFDLTKPELRKMLFFITDGAFPHNEVKIFKSAYRDAKEVGIDVIGIGIGTDAVANLWEDGDFFVIKDIRELAPQLFDILRKRMV